MPCARCWPRPLKSSARFYNERHLTAAEWLIYNILDLKFVQGMRVRDVAQRLAMSEADLYRKQRLAIEEVARTLKEMEVQGKSKIVPSG